MKRTRIPLLKELVFPFKGRKHSNMEGNAGAWKNQTSCFSETVDVI